MKFRDKKTKFNGTMLSGNVGFTLLNHISQLTY